MKNKKIFFPKLIITDFDGCLTDDRVWLNEHGEEFVAANRKDGLGIKRVKKLGIEVIIASTEVNKVVTARGKKLNLEVLQGLEDKKIALDSYLEKRNLKWKEVWYIGNEVNDLEALESAGFSVCPSDAVVKIKKISNLVLKTKGGYGIFSEIANILEKMVSNKKSGKK
ncbi:MAG: KdsC family phosphatase [Candidatus Nanopelagicales bacterium]